MLCAAVCTHAEGNQGILTLGATKGTTAHVCCDIILHSMRALENLRWAARPSPEIMGWVEEVASAFQAIMDVPSDESLMLNAEVRAMYELAKQALDK